MRWDDFRASENVEDRRGMGAGGAGGLGIGTIIILTLVGWALGIDPRMLIGGAEVVTQRAPQEQAEPGERAAPSDESGRFVAAVLGDTEDRWNEIFSQSGRRYAAPRLIMFSGATRSACGMAQSAMGPFYCPNDRAIYLDTAFFRDLETRFGGCEGKTCRFAQAYVIAHEVGHHVQNVLGLLGRVQEAQQESGDRRDANQLQVRVELQADCFAGVWANRAQAKLNFIEPGDVEAALQTAAAIGDDRLQRRSQGRVVPDSFTHGSSAQRVHWFRTGLTEGQVRACNTFERGEARETVGGR